MNNAEKFNEVFGSYATELWAKSEAELLEWLWAEYTLGQYCPEVAEQSTKGG